MLLRRCSWRLERLRRTDRWGLAPEHVEAAAPRTAAPSGPRFLTGAPRLSGRLRETQREFVRAVDAERRPPGHLAGDDRRAEPTGEHRYRLIQLGMGQRGAETVVRPGTELQQRRRTDNGDVERIAAGIRARVPLGRSARPRSGTHPRRWARHETRSPRPRDGTRSPPTAASASPPGRPARPAPAGRAATSTVRDAQRR